MRILQLTLFLSLSLVQAAPAESTWIDTAQNYTAQQDMPMQWEIGRGRKAPDYRLEDVIRALPAPETWGRLRSDYAKQLESNDPSAPSGQLMQCLLAYLDGDHESANKLLIRLEQTLNEKESGAEYSYFIERLKTALQNDQEASEPEALIETFLNELEEYKPVQRDTLITLVGSTEQLDQIDQLLDAQIELMQAYHALDFESLSDEAAEEAVAEIGLQAETLKTTHSEAMEAVEKNQEDPEFTKYLQTRLHVETDAYDPFNPSIAVPDLVTILGEARAKELLLEALKANTTLMFYNADASLRIAQTLALENIDQINVAQWHLIQNIDQVELYEAMSAKFPLIGDLDDQYTRSDAIGYYFWGLVAADRSEDAIALISETPDLVSHLPYNAINLLKQAGYTKEIWSFLDQLLSTYPEINLWEEYIALSAEVDRSERMLEVVEQAITASPEDLASQINKQQTLASAQLSAGHTEQAIHWLQQIVHTDSNDPEVIDRQLEAAIQLSEIGLLMENAEWTTTGLHTARSYIDSMELLSETRGSSLYQIQQLATLYRRAGEIDAALDLLDNAVHRMNQVGEAAVAKSEQDSDHYAQFSSLAEFQYQHRHEYQEILTALVGIEVKRGDHQAALNRLDQSTEWMVTDLKEIETQTGLAPEEPPLGYLAAKALHAQGEDATATRLLESLLQQDNGYDPAYALYLKIKGAEAIPYFDQLFALDQFQERPLIWKAQYAVNTGDIAGAEALAKQAIAIDPSDGEQPHGDRMRVYDVMRQIRLAQGDEKQAAFFAGVLAAIRLSENADLYYQAGIYPEAIQRYRESLNHFQDAYCIQSRLAVRLYDLGRVDEAIQHYKKAYALMPSSFGRVESHCFGCESVFKGEQPQSIAEEVFTSLLVETPEVPQVHYLIGYLRDYQNREVEALKHFQDAVALDPDYLNAWKKIQSLSQRMAITQELKDDLILKIYALDPLGNHSSAQLENVHDIKRMWRSVLKQQESLSQLPSFDSLYPFSAVEMVETSANESNHYWLNNREPIAHPAEVLLDHDIIASVEQCFIALSQE